MTRILILFLLFFLLSEKSSYCQQYGLRFSGAEVPQYQRTSLDLNSEGFLSFKNDFTLSFDLSFPPDLHRYYGYIIRIIDNEDTNIDLVFNYRDYSSTALTVINKNEQTNIYLETNLIELFDNWKTVELAYDLEKNELTLTFLGTSIVAKDIFLTNRIKILFGGSDYKHFKAIDVPPMIIRDIKISEGNKLRHHWPLKESNGNSENDLVKNKEAHIQNPTWIRRLFQNWEKVYNEVIDGRAAVIYNEKDEKIYLLGQTRMTIFNPSTKSNEALTYSNIPQSAIMGRQAFVDTVNDRLVLFNLWNTNFSSFDFNTLKWNNIYTGPQNPTLYWHFNKHFLAEDSSMLIFGGYGQYEFKNIVRKISLSNNGYDTLQTQGDTYHPRYLAALGAVNDTIFLLGGHGSNSGKQIESPTNFYDLTAFSLNSKEFTKVYDFTPPLEDVVFANSLVIDKTDDSFYALAFPNYQFHSYLQLVRGNFNTPDFEVLGDKIPFLFEDILSFADLFYCESINKLIAVTLNYNKEVDTTNFSVYTISFPPEKYIEKIDDTPEPFLSKRYTMILFVVGSMLIIVITIISFIAIFLGLVKNSPKSEADQGVEMSNREVKEILHAATEIIDYSTLDIKEVTFKNTILFFGGFKIFNKDSVDITNKFSPLLKEIFILLWLNSMKGYNGVSSEKLKELFWFDKDDKKAMNNRSVNIVKLKNLLGELDSCSLSRETGYWKIEFDNNVVYNDYVTCLILSENKNELKKNDVIKLINIVNKGCFLEDQSYEWLDAFKSEISNVMIDTLVEVGLSYDINQHTDFMVNLANTIFRFDIVNEEAMSLKCKALIIDGKHSLAKKCYSEFIKNYKALYDSEFEQSFSDIIKQDHAKIQ